MLGGHVLAQEQANSVSSSKDYEVIVNNSEAPQFEQATQEAVTDVLNEPVSKLEAPRPNLTSREVASVSKSEVASLRSEATSVASSEVASEIDRSATSEVAEARPTDREAVDTSLQTVSTNASHPGADGLVIADVSLDIPSNGTFYFRRTTEIRTAPVMDIKPTFVFSSGDHVIYDKVLTVDNHQWISYISYSGTRRYVDIATLKATESKPQENRVSGDLTISNQTFNGFDVIVTNVSGGGKTVQEVRVPIWSDKNGQDDLTWYHADKQSDGSYKVHVDTASHKGDTGSYSVHLYYVLDGKRTYVTETKATVSPASEFQVSGKLTNNGSYYSVRGKYDDIIIVNKKYGLSKDYNPGENSTAKAAFVRLRDDMINQGLNVGRSYSGFRSYDYIKRLFTTTMLVEMVKKLRIVTQHVLDLANTKLVWPLT